MSKGFKLIISIVGVLILCIIVDLVSIYTMKKPIFAVKGSSNNQYYGLFYDTYNCAMYSVPQIKSKGSKYSCLEDVKTLNQYAYTIEINEMIDCNGKKNLYLSRENQNIYTYCLDSINVNDGNRSIELKDYYKKNNRVIEEIINSLDYISTYEDGGSKLYRDNGNNGFTRNGMSIIECNTIIGNRDIYIGPSTMEYENTFCEYDENMREF